jgi:hypothetical protein
MTIWLLVVRLLVQIYFCIVLSKSLALRSYSLVFFLGSGYRCPHSEPDSAFPREQSCHVSGPTADSARYAQKHITCKKFKVLLVHQRIVNYPHLKFFEFVGTFLRFGL